MILLATAVAGATLIVGLVAALVIRRLSSVGSQIVATALVSLALPLVAVTVSGLIMFHMGVDVEILTVAAASAVAALGCAWVVTRSISHRLRAVREGAAAVATGSFAARVPERGPAEFADLARSFNRMAESVERLFSARQEVVAWVSHDLRSPIASLQAMIEATEDGVVAPAYYLSAMSDRVRALGGLVDDLFELASLDAGALSFELTDASVDSLVARCLQGFAAEADSRRVHLVQQIPPALPGVRCAPDAVQRVLDNLVANAFRFTPPGGSVTLTADLLDDQVSVVVEDSGAGFGPIDLKRATEPFWRADGARSLDELGRSHAGLGLTIAKALIELQGGDLLVANRSDGGGRVSFTLRCA